MRKLFIIISFLLCLSFSYAIKGDYSIIPLPQKIEARNGLFRLDKNIKIRIGDNLPDVSAILSQFNERLVKTFGFECKSGKEDGQIDLLLDSNLSQEGYHLDVASHKIIIKASTEAGFRHAFVTLSQLLPAEFWGETTTSTSATVPCVVIDDYPRFGYRGFHLDVARHFIKAEDVKKLLNVASLFKLNRFHWHLTDDQGWRIEIKKYPLLTQIGSIREESMEGTWDLYYPSRYDGKKHGGFYTQDEIRDVVRYAQERGITIIPEMDVPGHASAAIAAYPFLTCDQTKKHEVATKWGIFEDVFCPKEGTFGFIEDVLSELADLFPGEYIHLGGDECPKTVWAKCPHCQKLIKQEGLRDEHALQGYFMQRCEKIAKKYGKRMIGWDEIADEELPQDAIIMAWRGSGHGAVNAIRKGHEVIMTPSEYLYFDYNQEDPANAPLSIGGLIDLQKAYSYNPIPDSLLAESKYIKGVQANVWTEYIQDANQVEYMMYPRLTALAEIAWTENNKKDFLNYATRLRGIFERLDAMKVHACRAYYEPTFTSHWNDNAKQFEIYLNTVYPHADIYYTIDGLEPTNKSSKYTSPISLKKGATIKAITYSKNHPLSKILTETFVINKATGKKYTASSEGYSLDWYYVKRDVINDSKYGIIPDNGGWLQFGGDSVTLVFDLESVEDVSRFVIGCTRSPINNILGINKIICSFSVDGVNFMGETEFLFNYQQFSGVKEIHRKTFDITKQQARYVKIIVIGTEEMPNNYPYPNVKPSFAIDEIEIY